MNTIILRKNETKGHENMNKKESVQVHKATNGSAKRKNK